MRLKKEFTNRKTIGIGNIKGEICSLISLKIPNVFFFHFAKENLPPNEEETWCHTIEFGMK
tara:strand:+ start:323 stop:505 length:183 start_codon:yes stop_codon:yes gene_type:complete